MATSFYLLLLFLLSLLFLHPLPSTANIHKANNLLKTQLLTQPPTTTLSTKSLNDTTPPTVYFDVDKPIDVPNTKPCKYLILQHDFGFTYGKPPVFANYTPPSHCPSHDFSKIVLEWKASCKGRQFDRIFGVWLGGVELLRSCTAEPTATGIVWTVQKDITRYYSLLLKNQTQEFAVYLGNIVDNTYTGVYHVNVTVYFYTAEQKLSYNDPNNLIHGHSPNADLILPISRNLPLNDGLWFEIENSTDTEWKEFKIPQNAYRAVLEVYVSFHEKDEFWYSNLPDEYIIANNLTGYPENGAFREVLVSLDGNVVGAIWPFTVIYTGGINPLFWSPITGIASFDLPSYDIELTPFLGNILDGKTHTLGFSVTNALNVWLIDANLHLWLDHNSSKTEGELLKSDNGPLVLSLDLDFKDLNGTFLTRAHRSISSNGWVKSSHGEIITQFNQQFSYKNSMEMGKNGNLQIIDQLIHFNDCTTFRKPSSDALSFKSLRDFHVKLYSDFSAVGNDTSLSTTNVTLGFNVKNSKNAGLGIATGSIRDLQNAESVIVAKNNLVISAEVSTQQVYEYDDGKSCYFRNVSSSNYNILHDKVSNKCNVEQFRMVVGKSKGFSGF